MSDTITYSVAPNTVINAVAIGWGKTEDSSNAFYWWTHDIYRFIIEYESAPNVWVAAYVTTSRGAINTPEVYRFETPLTATTGNMRIRTRGLTHVENYNVGPAGGSEQTIYSGPYPHGNRNQITEVEFLQLTTPNPN